MSGGVVNIGYPELIGAALLMVVDAVISWRLRLGLEKRIAIASVRCFVQLLALGFILVYVFQFQSWPLVVLIMVIMGLNATQIATGRIRHSVKGLWPNIFVSIFVSSLIMALLVVDGIIHAEPWYHAQQMIPIAGMVTGNTLSSVAVAIERLFSDMDSRSGEIYTMIALGATPKEAAFPSIKTAIGAGMTPLLATMSAAGVVQIPGMMSGQILAGADPIIAAKYQIVVLLMISAATTISIVMACYLSYRKRFSEDGYYLEPGLRDEGEGGHHA